MQGKKTRNFVEHDMGLSRVRRDMKKAAEGQLTSWQILRTKLIYQKVSFLIFRDSMLS